MSIVLVIAAHPDDDILGCGGTLKKESINGSNIYTIFVSDGESSRLIKNNYQKLENRKKNANQASKIVGSQPPIFLDFNDQKLDNYPFLEITKKIEKYIFELNPDTVFTHSNTDLNIDHKIVHLAAVTATRPQKKLNLKNLFFFEILSSTEWNFSDSKSIFKPTYFIDIAKTINFKIKAIKEYKKELKNWPHPRSIEGIETLAKYRGMQVGKKYCEAFYAGKIIN